MNDVNFPRLWRSRWKRPTCCSSIRSLLAAGLLLLDVPVLLAQPVPRIGHWDERFFPAVAPEIREAAFDANGQLVVAGYFDEIERGETGGLAVDRIGSGWQPVAEGISWAGTLAAAHDGTLYAYVLDEASGEHYVGTWDGESWSRVAGGLADDVWHLAAAQEGTLYAAAWTESHFGSSGIGLVAWDGAQWNPIPDAPIEIDALETDGAGNVYALWGGAVQRWSADQPSWSAVAQQAEGEIVHDVVVTLNGSIYGLVRRLDAEDWVVSRWTGDAWEQLGAPFEPDGVPALFITQDQHLYRFVEKSGGLSLSRWDDGTWMAVVEGARETGSGRRIEAVAGRGGRLVVGGGLEFSNGVVNIGTYDGTDWAPVVALGARLHGHLAHLESDGVGNVYALGQLVRAGAVEVSSLARWNGFAWGSLDPPRSGASVMAAGETGTVYAGGGFGWTIDLAGVVTKDSVYTNVYAYDGGAWEPLPAFDCEGSLGAPVSINAMTIDDVTDELFVAGTCYHDSYDDRNQVVARWDGDVWEVIGEIPGPEPSLFARIHTIRVGPDGDLYVGGDFEAVDGLSAEGMARWDGERWHPLGAGLYSPYTRFSGRAEVLRNWADTLIVAGTFERAGPVAAPNVAAVFADEWQSVSSPLYGGRIGGVVTGPDGYLYASGSNGSENVIVRYDGLRWEKVAAGFLNPPRVAFDAQGGLIVDGRHRWIAPDSTPLEPDPVDRKTLRLSVFPNPTPGSVTLLIDWELAGRGQIEVFDPLGRRVMEAVEVEVDASGGGRVELDLAPLAGGVYFARVTFPQGRRVCRIVKL